MKTSRDRSPPECSPRGRVRLVPPRLGEVEQRPSSGDRSAQRWTQNLYGSKRHKLTMILGNMLLLAAMVGFPLMRGHMRARAAQRAYHRFIGCVFGVGSGGGLGELRGEAEYLAARLSTAERAWVAPCSRLLASLALDPALFVLPGVKEAEARVREAVLIVQSELSALAAHKPGEGMPERALRALELLRKTVRVQLERGGFSDREAILPVTLAAAPRLPKPSTLPLYAAPDASLELWGDDQTLRVVALDATGLSFLEVESGKPFTRARLPRPRSLRGFLRSDERSWLLWATPSSRCAQRADGCVGKTTQVAAVSAPLLHLPETRALAAHVAGRIDRSVAPTASGLLMATAAPGGQQRLQEFALPPGFAVGVALPPAVSLHAWPSVVEQTLVLSAKPAPAVFGLQREGAVARLVRVSAGGVQPLARLHSGSASWLSGCAADMRAGVAFGDGTHLLLASVDLTNGTSQPELWPELAWSAPNVIDDDAAFRDRIVVSCLPGAVLVVAHDAGDELSALVCRLGETQCTRLSIARAVTHLSVLRSGRGALVAYAGDDAPQIRVRSIDAEAARLGPELVPAGCWTTHGLCKRPTLARLGQRVVLLAPDKTDLLALESEDEGRSFRPVPVL